MGVQVNSYFKSKYTGAQIENMLDAFGNTAAAYETSTAYSVGDLVLYNNALYVCTGATTGTFDPSKWQQTTLAELVENLGATYTDPNSDGNVVIGVEATVGEKILRSLTFPGLTNRYYLPFAQYIRTQLANDPASASFDVEIPDAEEAPMHSTVIKGKTVAVNQLCKNGDFVNTSGWSVSYSIPITASNNVASLTVNATAVTNQRFELYRSMTTIVGHKYYLTLDLKSPRYGSATMVLGGISNAITYETENTWQTMATIGESTTVGTLLDIYIRSTSFVANDVVQVRNVNVVDLTTIFSAAELVTIGSSVATFKSLWLTKRGTPLPAYIPYNAGSLANVNGEYRLRGRNLWDEEWELGSISGVTGENAPSSTISRSKNYIPVNEGDSLYIRIPSSKYGNFNFFYYDANYNFISLGWTVTASAIATVPSGVRYIRFRAGTTLPYGNDICIILSDASINGQYFPHYNGGTIDCSTAPLNGVGTAQDEKDFATGKRTTRFKDFTVSTATSFASFNNGGNGIVSAICYAANSYIDKPKLYPDGGSVVKANAVSDKMVVLNSYHSTPRTETAPSFAFGSDGSFCRIYISDQSGTITDLASFQANCPTMHICYELATPTTSTETPQPVYTQYGYNVFEPVSGGVQSAEVGTTYYENIAGYIDKKLAEA